jgi:hypothetical protein
MIVHGQGRLVQIFIGHRPQSKSVGCPWTFHGPSVPSHHYLEPWCRRLGGPVDAGAYYRDAVAIARVQGSTVPLLCGA